jgi:hypothetical protein
VSELRPHIPPEGDTPATIGDLLATPGKQTQPLEIVDPEDARKAKPKGKPKPVRLTARRLMYAVAVTLAALGMAAVVMRLLPVRIVMQADSPPLTVRNLPVSAGDVPQRYDYVLTRDRGMTMRAQVRITDVMVADGAWLYQIVGLDEEFFKWANHEYLVYISDERAPAIAAPRFLSSIGSADYPLVTTMVVDTLLPYARVRIGHPWFNGDEWVYPAISDDGRGVFAILEQRLDYAVSTGITETPGITPTPVFGGMDMMEANLMTTVPIGDIPVNTRVRIETMHYNGIEWVYVMVTDTNPMRRFGATSEQLTRVPELTGEG